MRLYASHDAEGTVHARRENADTTLCGTPAGNPTSDREPMCWACTGAVIGLAVQRLMEGEEA